MSNPTPQAPTEVEPWNEKWGAEDLFAMATPAPKPSKPAESAPWEMDWGLKAAITLTAPQATTFEAKGKFNQVFTNLIQAESRGRHKGKDGQLLASPVGALGITQVMPKTGKDPGYGIRPLQNDSEEEYLRLGREYLQAMLNVYDGDYSKAVAAYNAGPGNVDKAIAQATKKGGDWTQYLPKKEETLPYMQKILGDYSSDVLSKQTTKPNQREGGLGKKNPQELFEDYFTKAKEHWGMEALISFLDENGHTPSLQLFPARQTWIQGEYNISKNQVRINERILREDPNEAINTIIHEYAHAADIMVNKYGNGLRADLLKGKSLTDEEEKFVSAFNKLGLRQIIVDNDFTSRARQVSESFDKEWTEQERGYRANTEELLAFGIADIIAPPANYKRNRLAGKAPREDSPLHLDSTLASNFSILIELARKAKASRKKDG